jgi:hypothetical protein
LPFYDLERGRETILFPAARTFLLVYFEPGSP